MGNHGQETTEPIAEIVRSAIIADLLDHLDLPDGASDALVLMKLLIFLPWKHLLAMSVR